MRIFALSNSQVMTIMREHDAYRRKKQEYDQQYPEGKSPVDPGDKWIAEYYNRPLMTDAEFLEKFRVIVPEGAKVVTTPQVMHLFNLRSEYEFQPPIKNRGRVTYTKYTMPTIRLRVGTSRAKIERKTASEKDKNILIPLTETEMREVFSVARQHGHWFILEKVLRTPLGRQQRAEKIMFSDERPPKRERGRPLKETTVEKQENSGSDDEKAMQHKIAELQEELLKLKAQ